MTSTDERAIIHYNNNIMLVSSGGVVMKYARIQEFVARCRKRMGIKGCKECGKVLPCGLFLRGAPTLSALTRQGFGPECLKISMRSRGWYCRGCTNKIREGGGTTATTTLRGQFATEQEYLDYLYKRDYLGDNKLNEAPRYFHNCS